jgi:hypothetical protein
MDIYPISFVKNFASIVTVSEQQKARPDSTTAKGKILPLKPKISGTER